jgi:hypothetical protein
LQARTTSLVSEALSPLQEHGLIPQTKFIDQYDYELTLEPDIYGWVVVVWFPDIPVYFFGIKELGAYYQNPDQLDIPTPVNVIPGSMTPNINITADFANIDRETPFFEIRRRRCPY